jgi:hypothetical protein
MPNQPERLPGLLPGCRQQALKICISAKLGDFYKNRLPSSARWQERSFQFAVLDPLGTRSTKCKGEVRRSPACFGKNGSALNVFFVPISGE